MQYLLAPQNGKYEAPASAAALMQQTLSDERALDEQEMTRLYRDIELPLLATLYDMERDGFLVDRDELNRLGEQYDAQIAELKNEIFSLCGVAPFNLNSPQQLGGVLFDTLGLPAKKKTARGYSTDADTLGELAELHPAVEKILLYRQVAKLKSTYIDGLLRLTGRDGRIHTWFDQTIAATGRISSSEPNLQNIPVRTPMGREIRRAFIARRRAACSWTRTIRRSSCASSPTFRATRPCARPSPSGRTSTPARRRRSTACRSTRSRRRCAPARRPSISASSTASAISAWPRNLRHLPQGGRRLYRALLCALSRRPSVYGCVRRSGQGGRAMPSRCIGRRRPLPELSSPNYNRRQFGERAAMNTPVQGAAADIIKIAMNAVHDELESRRAGREADFAGARRIDRRSARKRSASRLRRCCAAAWKTPLTCVCR